MLGDTGSNVIGAVAGLWLVLTLDVTGLAIAVGVLVALTALRRAALDQHPGRTRSRSPSPRLARKDPSCLTPHASPATSSSPAASCRRSGRASPPRRSAACSSPAACASACRSSTRTSTSIPGTMSPYQHGEVFVTEDGAETDLDLGHYERFTDANTVARVERHRRRHLQLGHPPRAPRRLPRRAPSRSSRTSPTRSSSASA